MLIASATQPTLRQWSRTEMPGWPSLVVFAQKLVMPKRAMGSRSQAGLFSGALIFREADHARDKGRIVQS